MSIKTGYYVSSKTNISIIEALDGTHITFHNKESKINIFVKMLNTIFSWLKKG